MIYDCVLIAANAGCNGRSFIEVACLLRGHPMRPQLAVVEVIPPDKMIVPGMEPTIIVVSHVMSMERKSNAHGK